MTEESKNNLEHTLDSFISEDEDEPDKLTIVPFKLVLNEQNSFMKINISNIFQKNSKAKEVY